MRLPIPIVTTHLKAILDGILLWSADTKNQFKLKVRNQALVLVGLVLELLTLGCRAPHLLVRAYWDITMFTARIGQTPAF